MQILLYTVTAILLYVVSDWILVKLEQARGARFESRSLIFFGIILVLSIVVFEGIQRVLVSSTPPQESASTMPDSVEKPAPSIPE